MTAFKITAAAVAFLLLLGVVTPWMVNQDSTLTLIAVPFVWLAFAGLVKKAIFTTKEKK